MGILSFRAKAGSQMARSDTTTDPIVSIQNIHKRYGDLHVLRGISLEIKLGQVVVVCGPSGCG